MSSSVILNLDEELKKKNLDLLIDIYSNIWGHT